MSEALEQSDLREGYKEVQFGPKTLVVPNEWSAERFGDVFHRRRESIDEIDDETVKYVGLKNIDSGQLDINGYGVDGRERSSSRVFREGDVLFGKLRPNLNKAAIAPFSGVCSSDILPIYAEEDARQQYLPYLMHSKLVRDRVVSTMEGTNLPRTSWGDLEKTLVPLPSLSEQRRIADILSTVDEQVQQTDEIIEETKELRYGLMQELLLRGIDHEEFQKRRLGLSEVSIPESWNVQNAGSLFNLKKTGFDPSDHTGEVYLYSMPAFDDGKEPVVTPAEEIGSKKRIVPEDTILFPKLNIRKKRFWRVRQDHNLPAICSTEYWPLTATENAYLDFYRFYFESYHFMSDPKVSSSSSTNSHKRVTQSSFKKVQLPVPPIEEQRQIADTLKTASEKIEQEYKQKENLQELKRGLMQDLLTGKVRVNTD